MKKVFVGVGIVLLVGIVYMTVRLSMLTKDNTIYDVNGVQVIPSDENNQDSQPTEENKNISPSNDEIIARIYPEKTYKKISDTEYALVADIEGGVIGNTFVPGLVVRGDLDGDLYTDAFVISEVTGAASVSNTGYLVTRKGVKETFDGTSLEGRILFLEAGFTANRQLYIVYIQAITGEKERVLYDYSVINGEMTLKKISSRITPATNQQPKIEESVEEPLLEEAI